MTVGVVVPIFRFWDHYHSRLDGASRFAICNRCMIIKFYIIQLTLVTVFTIPGITLWRLVPRK